MLGRSPEDAFVQLLFKKIYENLMQEIDAIDNGVDICPQGAPTYEINTNLSSRVGRSVSRLCQSLIN